MSKTRNPRAPKTRGHFILDENTAFKRRKHAVLIADAIHRSTLLDTQIGATLAFLLKLEAAPAMAMYEAVRNATAQVDTIRAVAKTKLGDEDAKLFADVLSIASRAQKDRHRFAHWLWGHYDDPAKKDSIFLMEPEVLMYAWQSLASIDDVLTLFDNGERLAPKLRTPLATMEYTLKTLRSVRARLDEAYLLVMHFQMYAHIKLSGKNAPVAERLRQLLLDQPAISELHKNREQGRRSKPKVPPPPPRKSPRQSSRKPPRGRKGKDD